LVGNNKRGYLIMINRDHSFFDLKRTLKHELEHIPSEEIALNTRNIRRRMDVDEETVDETRLDNNAVKAAGSRGHCIYTVKNNLKS